MKLLPTVTIKEDETFQIIIDNQDNNQKDNQMQIRISHSKLTAGSRKESETETMKQWLGRSM